VLLVPLLLLDTPSLLSVSQGRAAAAVLVTIPVAVAVTVTAISVTATSGFKLLSAASVVEGLAAVAEVVRAAADLRAAQNLKQKVHIYEHTKIM
jgi:hypothetical protein